MARMKVRQTSRGGGVMGGVAARASSGARGAAAAGRSGQSARGSANARGPLPRKAGDVRTARRRRTT